MLAIYDPSAPKRATNLSVNSDLLKHNAKLSGRVEREARNVPNRRNTCEAAPVWAVRLSDLLVAKLGFKNEIRFRP
jgi:hypothetical protein